MQNLYKNKFNKMSSDIGRKYLLKVILLGDAG